jgi:membrane protease YdiL (CAAX protease family)
MMAVEGTASHSSRKTIILFLILVAVATAVVAGCITGANAFLDSHPEIDAQPALADILFTLAVFIPLALLAVIGCAGSRVRPQPGIQPGLWVGPGFAIGVAGVAIGMTYTWICGGLSGGGSGGGFTSWWFAGTALIMFQVMTEEVYFRGWMQPVLQRVWGGPAAVLLTALGFAVVHLASGPRPPLTLLNLFLGGLLFGLLALRSRGLVAPIAAHFGWNWSEQLVLGLDPNPAVGSFGSLYDFELTGMPFWGGSTEGLNMSIGTTFVLVALILPLAVWRFGVTLHRAPSAVQGVGAV